MIFVCAREMTRKKRAMVDTIIKQLLSKGSSKLRGQNKLQLAVLFCHSMGLKIPR